jgi:hypothetical protein
MKRRNFAPITDKNHFVAAAAPAFGFALFFSDSSI